MTKRKWTGRDQRAVDALAMLVVRGLTTRKEAAAKLAKLLVPRSLGSVDARLGYTMGVYRKKHRIPARPSPYLFGANPLGQPSPMGTERMGMMTLNLFPE